MSFAGAGEGGDHRIAGNRVAELKAEANLVEERAAARRAKQAKKAERQAEEFDQLDTDEARVAWLRTELTARAIGESRLLTALDNNRTGTVGVNEV